MKKKYIIVFLIIFSSLFILITCDESKENMADVKDKLAYTAIEKNIKINKKEETGKHPEIIAAEKRIEIMKITDEQEYNENSVGWYQDWKDKNENVQMLYKKQL